MGGESGGGSVMPTTPAGYAGGSVMNFTPPAFSASPVQGGGFNWSGFGKSLGSGLESAGNSLGNYSTPPISSSGGNFSQSQPYGANPLPFTMIPESQGGGDIVALLQRLLGGG